jgi:hypothetical protein
MAEQRESDPCEYEHVDTVTIYEGEDGTQWICRTCGAEGWEEADDA